MSEREAVREALHRLFLAVPGVGLRREDKVKAEELVGFLALLRGRLSKRAVLLDAAAGRAPVGLLAVERLGVSQLVVIEREAGRAAACRDAAGRLTRPAMVDVREGDVEDDASWPTRLDVVVALHACGRASDAVFAQGARRAARWMIVAPCCYAATVPFATRAREIAEVLGAGTHAAVRRPLMQALIDAERTLTLEAAGYEVTVVPFTAPTVSPHHLAWVCRRVGEPRAMETAARRLASLHGALQGESPNGERDAQACSRGWRWASFLGHSHVVGVRGRARWRLLGRTEEAGVRRGERVWARCGASHLRCFTPAMLHTTGALSG